jgi:thiosulfate reductase cytochrome b subunit
MRSLLLFISLLVATPMIMANTMHPDFRWRDENGYPIDQLQDKVSADQTCAQCHDVHFIRNHTIHNSVSCFACHLKVDPQPHSNTGALIERPTASHCGKCHGIVHTGWQALTLPEDFGSSHTSSLSANTGAIFSSQLRSESGLNLKNKQSLTFPWDVHMARGLDCTSCHYSPNNPRRITAESKGLSHLKKDPRSLTISQYLYQPSHLLKAAVCTDCHDPETGHDYLPYKKRHFAALDCQACHSSITNTPILQSANKKTGKLTFRDINSKENLNTQYLEGLSTQLLAYKTIDGKSKIAPFNLVTTLDGNTATVKPHKVSHGIHQGRWGLIDCRYCHGEESRFRDDVFLTGLDIDPKSIQLAQTEDTKLFGGIIKSSNNQFFFRRNFMDSSRYVFGFDRMRWIDYLGILIVLATLLGVGGHGGYRFISRKARTSTHGPTKRVYMYTVYERIWHWTSAFAIIVLIITGFEIHFASSISLIGYKNAVLIHNAIAFVMLANAALAFFFHLASARIRQYLPATQGFFGEAIDQVKYYTYGIFRGEPHPLQKTPDRKLNPLQQVTYLGLLNILLPLQVATGLLIWGAERWPQTVDSLGGLVVIAPIHTIGSWLFLSFLIAHIYLTTTGHTVTSNIKAMVTGYEDMESSSEGGHN